MSPTDPRTYRIIAPPRESAYLTKTMPLSATRRDHEHLPAMPDPDPCPPPIEMRTPRDTGTTPAQIQARLQAALERRPQDYQPEALERLLADVRGER
jgi:hypothetical protein